MPSLHPASCPVASQRVSEIEVACALGQHSTVFPPICSVHTVTKPRLSIVFLSTRILGMSSTFPAQALPPLIVQLRAPAYREWKPHFAATVNVTSPAAAGSPDSVK